MTAPAATRHKPNRWTKVLVPAVDGIRMYPRTAGLISLLVGGALAVALPIAWFTLWRAGGLQTALGLHTLAPTGDAGPYYSPASRIQTTALLTFWRLLVAVGMALIGLSLFAALGLSASRASQRSGETIIRRAVGAGRTTLFAGLTLEGILLAVISLGAAIIGGITIGWLLFRGWTDGTSSGESAVGLAAAGVTALLLIAGTLIPVLFARRQQLGEPTTRPVPLIVPGVQLGLSLIVLVAGALLASHASRLLRTSNVEGQQGQLYVVPRPESSKTARAGSYAELLSRIESPAGVSLTSAGATLGAGPTNRITTDCGQCMDGTIPARYKRVTVTQQVVSADSFHALGVGVIAGRSFTRGDSIGAKPVVIVSQSLARDFFQFGAPLGRSLRIQAPAGMKTEGDEWYEVVGIVEDRKSNAMGGARQPLRAIYLSVLQEPPLTVELLVRADAKASSPAQVADALQTSLGVAAAQVKPTSPAALLAAESDKMEWFGRRIGLLGITMLLIAAIGTATLMRSWVISLRPELGLRRAVGATSWQLLRLMLGQALKVAIAGTFLGIWFGPPVWDSLGSTLRDIQTWNPGLVALLASLLFLSTIAGVIFPALRATRSTAAELLASAEE